MISFARPGATGGHPAPRRRARAALARGPRRHHAPPPASDQGEPLV